jgi:hypothetical protein
MSKTVAFVLGALVGAAAGAAGVYFYAKTHALEILAPAAAEQAAGKLLGDGTYGVAASKAIGGAVAGLTGGSAP